MVKQLFLLHEHVSVGLRHVNVLMHDCPGKLLLSELLACLLIAAVVLAFMHSPNKSARESAIPCMQICQLAMPFMSHRSRCCSDEIYANSIFKPDSQFTSMAVLASQAEEHGLDPEDVQSYVHVIFGMSKDWCASGLRVGCMWTQNTRLRAALQNINAFCGVSGIVQYMIAEMLEDLSFVDTYLEENARRLGGAYDTLAGTR